MAQAARARRHRQRGDVPVPGEVVGLQAGRFDGLVGLDGREVRRGFELAQDWGAR